jgi:uncharacterized protein YbjT (DUF2867 family)
MENRNRPTAIISGATGLVGEQLLNQLLADPFFGKVTAVVRNPIERTHDNLEQRVIDFGMLTQAMSRIQADYGFCCLGTTIKAAGSREKQFVVDHDYVVAFARGCLNAGVTRFAVVSSIGANAESSNFYLRTKGEMERDVMLVPFISIFILQPSFLLGERKEFRAGEKAGIAIMKVINPLLAGGLKKYRGVEASAVARCMITKIRSESVGVKTIRSDEIA